MPPPPPPVRPLARWARTNPPRGDVGASALSGKCILTYIIGSQSSPLSSISPIRAFSTAFQAHLAKLLGESMGSPFASPFDPASGPLRAFNLRRHE